MDGMMKRFFLMTRGRTGSTAVIDELTKSSICAMHELFLMHKLDVHTPEFKKIYELLLPFDLWKPHAWWLRWMPSSIWGDAPWARRYLEKAEGLATHQGMAGFCFKVLSHQFDQRPFLKDLLRQRGYQAVYLTRNLARQVLSGMVASQRGVYNSLQGPESSSCYQIDVDEFEQLVQWEKRAVVEDRALLSEAGFVFAAVSYEEFCADRQSFYESIFQFLGLPAELPPTSDFSIMIRDLRTTIENYDAVAERAASMGVILEP